MKAEARGVQKESKGSVPLGVSKSGGYYDFAVFLPGTEACALHIYDLGKSEATVNLSLFAQEETPGLFTAHIHEDELPECFGYRYSVSGREFLDPYVKYTVGRERFGAPGECFGVAGEETACAYYARKNKGTAAYRPFCWGEDKAPRLAYEDMILYKLHVRGFTMTAPGVRHKGTYLGLLEKKDYLLELGVNALLLLPCTEFDELSDGEAACGGVPAYARMPKPSVQEARKSAEKLSGEEGAHRLQPPARVNYWGFAKESSYFAPKASYASKPQQAASEFKRMVRGMHESGIEVLLEMNFKATDNPNLIRDCLIWWVQEYHVDGFRYNTDLFPARVAALCPELAGVKLLSAGFGDAEAIGRVSGFGAAVRPLTAESLSGMAGQQEGTAQFVNAPGAAGQYGLSGRPAAFSSAPGYGQSGKTEKKTVLAEYNEGFLTEIRRFVKGDEEMVGAVAARLERQTGSVGTINYLADHNGFTLADVYAYDVKHNEANGEDNRDGTDYNFSWNCGAEGATKKKKILKLRSQMRKNALLLLFTAQGTPMLLAGDEFGNTQEGNNNAYCQDNETGWVSWKELRANREQFAFVKELIALRKAHPVLHNKIPLRGTDYISCGCPDVSRHGTKAWYVDYSNYSRTLAMLFCGKYAMLDRNTPDQSIYIAANMHWEPHTFDLPDVGGGEELTFLLCSDPDCTGGKENEAGGGEAEKEAAEKGMEAEANGSAEKGVEAGANGNAEKGIKAGANGSAEKGIGAGASGAAGMRTAAEPERGRKSASGQAEARNRTFEVPPRSIALFIGKTAPVQSAGKKKARGQNAGARAKRPGGEKA